MSIRKKINFKFSEMRGNRDENIESFGKKLENFNKKGFYDFAKSLKNEGKVDELVDSIVVSLPQEVKEILTTNTNVNEVYLNDEENVDNYIFGIEEDIPCSNIIIKILEKEVVEPCEKIQYIIKRNDMKKPL